MAVLFLHKIIRLCLNRTFLQGFVRVALCRKSLSISIFIVLDSVRRMLVEYDFVVTDIALMTLCEGKKEL